MMSVSALNILYVGPGHQGTCKSRRLALESLGHSVTPLNPYDFFRFMPALSFSVYARILRGPATIRFNRELLKSVKQHRFDWIWVDKGIFLFPETVSALRSMGCFLIHHLTDDFLNPALRLFYRYYKRALLDYHVHLTSNCFNVRELRDLGVAHAVQTYLGFGEDLCHPGGHLPTFDESLQSEVAFVGFWRPHLDSHIIPLIENGIDVKIWGSGWRRSSLRRSLAGQATFRQASNDEYPRILASTKIALCFLNRESRNTSTGRSFEIPAIGAFMLGERTDEHRSFFEEGKEAEFFDSPEEMIEKTAFYLTHDEARRKIAAAGHRRALISGYSYRDRIKKDVENVMPIYEGFLKKREQ